MQTIIKGKIPAAIKRLIFLVVSGQNLNSLDDVVLDKLQVIR